MTIQKACTWIGYDSLHFARTLGRTVEKITRPIKTEAKYRELAHRVMQAAYSILILAPLSLIGLPFSILFLSLASLGGSRLEIIDTGALPLTEQQIVVKSINSCLQESLFAPQTGGVVPPFDSVEHYPTRIAALADALAGPEVIAGQEFHDLRSQNAFVKEMQRRGYRYFVIDRAPHPVLMNSGLLFASKVKLKDAAIIPYPLKDRIGLAKGTQQGALVATYSEKDGKTYRIFNTHLNYGSTQICQEARNRQLKNHILPLFNKTDLLVGDLNMDTSDPVVKEESGLERLVNHCEGQVTCTNEGEIALRGKKVPLILEKIDGIIAHPEMKISAVKIEKLVSGKDLLSDHFAVSAILH